MSSSQQPFQNPDPFGSADEGDKSGSSSDAAEHASASPTQPTAERQNSHLTIASTNGKKGSGSDRSEAASTAEGVMEKISTKVDDTAHHVLDKMNSVRHMFHMEQVKATGPAGSKFLNPSNIRMRVRYHDGPDASSGLRTGTETELMWRARDNRKGRNSIAVPAMPSSDEPTFLPLRYTPKIKSGLKDILRTFWRMSTTFPYWDMAFWSGMTYTIGSALFVLDGVFAWGPVAFGEEFEPASVETYGGPLSFFIGALLYQVGAVAAYLEAVNDGSFHGAAMRRLLEGHEDDQKRLLDEKLHHFFSGLTPWQRDKEEALAHVDPEAGWRTKEQRHLRPGSIYPTGKAPAPRRGAVDMGGEAGHASAYLTWRWWPTWHAVKTHHRYEIGWIATTIQLFGVTLYGVTAIVVLPWILSTLAPWQKLAAFWVPQAVAASCFLVASIMFMLETQTKWWKPELGVLGWWVGFWATIGSVGFIAIAGFGIRAGEYTWCEYQSDLATIWGSSAYLICSFLQWYEAMTKNPVEELFNEPGEMKSYQVVI